jgi:hypothetical protein
VVTTEGSSEPPNAQSAQPASTTARRLADHPHWWTIILGIVAIVVSSFSYQESHRSRILNEAINRPLVRVVSIAIGGPALGNVQPVGSRFPNYYSLKIRNSGKSFADKVKVTYKAQIEDTRCCEGFLRFSDFEGASTDTVSIGDLAPDDEYDLSLWAYILKDNPTVEFGDHRLNMVSLYIVGDTQYTSPINGQEYHEHFCFIDAGTQGHFQRCSSKEPVYK